MRFYVTFLKVAMKIILDNILVSFVVAMFRLLQLFWKGQQDYKRPTTLCRTESQIDFHLK